MRLLVSVAHASEATAAYAGGADLIDAKDPFNGALGAVSVETLRQIHAAIGGARPITAALGDAADEGAIERAAFEFAAAGTTFVKVGFASITSPVLAMRLIAAAVRGARDGSEATCGVVAVGYGDADPTSSMDPLALVDAASQAGAIGVLLDTADKQGPGLPRIMSTRTVTAWIARARDAGLLTALAGRLTMSDLPWVRDCGADIAGVRGAACDGGRTGHTSAEKVRRLRAAALEDAVDVGASSL
jgi:uncharacterized protein (UPF0264 family)